MLEQLNKTFEAPIKSLVLKKHERFNWSWKIDNQIEWETVNQRQIFTKILQFLLSNTFKITDTPSNNNR